MKGATEYARRLRRFLSPLKKQKRKSGADRQAAKTREVIEEVLVAILEEDTRNTTARSALRKLMECMVDYNDLRVTTPRDLILVLGRTLPDPQEKADRISRILNHVYNSKNSLNLESLRDKSIRDARQYLNLLEGMTPFVCATVVRRCLGGHAIPVDEALLRFLKDEELVPAEASRPEVQAFLERHVLATDAHLFSSAVRERALAHFKRIRAKRARALARKASSPSAKRAKKTTRRTGKTKRTPSASRAGRTTTKPRRTADAKRKARSTSGKKSRR